MVRFTISVPTTFEYKEQQGIDSFVGRITDGRTDIRFDYGWYTNPGPRLGFDLWINQKLRGIGYLAEALEKENAQFVPFSDYWRETELLSISTIHHENSDKTYQFEYQNSTKIMSATVDRGDIGGFDDEFLQYDFDISLDECRYTKLYARTSGKPDAGIITFNDCEYASKIGMLPTLGVYITNYRKRDSLIIDRILRSVTLIER